MAFRLTLTSSFRKRLHKKPPNQQGPVLECIARLADNPRHPSLKCRRIQGTANEWEARIDASNRVSWQYGETGEIIVINHCKHDSVLP